MVSKNLIKFVHSLELKKYRNKENLFVAEGPKVVGDLLELMPAHTIVATADWLNTHTPTADNIYSVTDDELAKVSFLQHPQKVVGIFPIPTCQASIKQQLYLALDGVQDPGNLGTIIRIADWFGIDTIFCSKDTADAYNPKVIQATMGSIARVKIVYTNLAQLFSSLPPSFPVYGTLLEGNNIYKQPLSEQGIIVMGNEGKGISPEIRQYVNSQLLIPSYHLGKTAESLNVAIATAITCAEFRRRNA